MNFQKAKQILMNQPTPDFTDTSEQLDELNRIAHQKYNPEHESIPKSGIHLNLILISILLIATFLYTWKIWDAGEANSFYTAAITSMTQNFKNFWFASFDPAGYITVDKPPVALWFMTISAKIFGIHGWSIVLPSILFGVGSVGLIYELINKHFGKIPGYLSAIAMTFTPIMVADSRTNNMDTTLIFFLLLSVYLLDLAIRKKQSWLVVISFTLIGVSFNIKMLQAFMILPTMYLFYWLASRSKKPKRIITLFISTVIMVALMLSWPLSVDLTPTNQRPYEGGSQHNSVMELAFGYNGTQRLLGQSSSNQNQLQHQQPRGIRHRRSHQHTRKPHQQTPTLPGKHGQSSNSAISKGGGGGPFNIGTVGPLRLLQSQLGPQISWLIIFTVIGLISSMIFYHSRRRWYQFTNRQKETILWGSWLIPVASFFSIANFFHPYYMIMLAPPTAALFGIGTWTMYQQMKHHSFRNYQFYFLPIALLGTVILQAWYVSANYKWLSWILIIMGSLITFNLITSSRTNYHDFKHFLIMGIALIMVSPAWWAATPTIAGSSSGIPTAGPDILSSRNQQAPGSRFNRKLFRYLKLHNGHAKYLFATSDSNSASPYIIKSHRAVMAMGGFTGNDPAMKLSRFKKLVKGGKIKFYYGSQSRANQLTVNWIKKHGQRVNPSKYRGASHQTHGPNSKDNLYNLSHIYH